MTNDTRRAIELLDEAMATIRARGRWEPLGPQEATRAYRQVQDARSLIAGRRLRPSELGDPRGDHDGPTQYGRLASPESM